MNWQEIIENLGVFGIISGLITWLIKSFGDNLISKRFKAYEQELKLKSQEFQANLNKMLQSHKFELELISQKANKLHEKRLLVIEELYKKILKLERELRILAHKSKVSKPDDRENEFQQFEKASEIYSEFVRYFMENRIYFSKETCDKIEEIQNATFSSLSDYSFARNIPVADVDALLKQVDETLNNDIPDALSIIEKEFRELIGVNDKLKKKENDH